MSSNFDFEGEIISHFMDSIHTKQKFIEVGGAETVNAICEAVVTAFQNGHKLLLCGNGGSAADSQHVAAEFVSRFSREREAIPAIALTTDTSIITAISNDYSYERIFSRQVEALGQEGDVIIGITTSGNSANILEAFKVAKDRGMTTIAFTGETGGVMKTVADICLCVPSEDTACVQETHIAISHSLCEVVELAMYSESPESIPVQYKGAV